MIDMSLLNLEKILEDWKKESVIDDTELDKTSIESSKLHSKYVELLATAKLKHRSEKNIYDELIKNKWLYYSGKMTKEQMDDFDWDYNPFGKAKVLKGDFKYYFDSDKELQKQQTKIKYYETVMETIIDILDNIKWRHQNIRNIIDWRKFNAGF
jgi:hypothetical protein